MLITSSTIFLCGSEKMSDLTQQAQQRIVLAIGDEIHAQAKQVQAAIGLLDEGATVPFIARYRKEVTGGLDDTQLRLLQERLICVE